MTFFTKHKLKFASLVALLLTLAFASCNVFYFASDNDRRHRRFSYDGKNNAVCRHTAYKKRCNLFRRHLISVCPRQ